MRQRCIICIGCPKGCPITITHEGKNIQKIEGYSCENGYIYAKNEFAAPVRIFTSTLRVNAGELELVPVKTTTPVPKNMLMDCARESCRIIVNAPVNIGDVLCENFCGTGSDLVATRDVLQK
ncbi:MAG: DUF1667 domain-containing protein [Hespellia sp.]|nr:DUF1667 domain-containing protein [Hespellia sp.]